LGTLPSEGSVSFGYPPGRYCQWAGFVPEEVVRLAQKGRVSDNRERSKCSMVTGGVLGNMDIYFWGLLGVDEYLVERISSLDQPKVKYLAEQISPNGTKYDRQIMEKHKAAVMSSHLQTLMVTGGVWGNMDIYFWGLLGVDGCIQVFEGNRWCMGEHGYIFLGYDRQIMEKHKAAVMSSHLQTFEYNHQSQGVPNNIYPCSPIHHLLPSNTYSSLCHLKLSPFGPISLLPPVQSLPIGNTMTAALCFSIICLSYLVPFGEICSA
jgi:hypothetical protein